MLERLKNARKNMGLSQEYVAKYLGVSRTTLVDIENGKRKITSDDVKKFSELYGLSTDEILYGKVSESEEIKAFARSFSELSEIDKLEIMNLIEFKKKYKENMG